MSPKSKEAKREYDQKRYYGDIDYQRERARKYREENKDTINAKKKEKYQCECGGKYTTNNMHKHLETDKHQKYINDEPPKPDPSSTIYECQCGSLLTLRSKPKHEKSPLHVRYLEKQTITTK